MLSISSATVLEIVSSQILKAEERWLTSISVIKSYKCKECKSIRDGNWGGRGRGDI